MGRCPGTSSHLARLAYLQVVAAQVKALLALGRKDEARTVLSDRGNALSFELKRDLEREVGA